MFCTAESVTIGHPDKICDQIADKILDEYLRKDKNSRVACEVSIHYKGVLVMGEITSIANVDIDKIVRKTIIDIGYDNDNLGFNGNNCEVTISINKQSSDIALGVDKDGAGDQGIMVGYATNETETYMPYPIFFANQIAQQLTKIRKDKILNYLRPDGKCQVTVEYNDKIRIDTIIVSTQHDEIDLEQLKKDIKKYVIYEVIDKKYIDKNTKILINPTGRFVIGGPIGDSGLTGRKIIADSYGPMVHHGGGSYSGKDYTKVDRSAAYYARYVAKNIVASGLADKIEIQVFYAIGIEQPISISINTFNTNKVDEFKIMEIIKILFDFRPKKITKELALQKPIYNTTTCFGHFGKKDLPWEQINKVDEIKNMI